jgi:hypothetical protein
MRQNRSDHLTTETTNPLDAAEIARTIMPEVYQQLTAKLVESLAYDVYQAASKAVAEDVKVFVDAEVVPALRASMAERKDEIIATLAAEVGKVGPQIAAKLAESAAKQLTSDYKFRALLKALFGDAY